MMTECLSPQEVGLLIRSRKMLKQKGLPKDADVKTICEAAGVSRKTGYQWAKGLKLADDPPDTLIQELSRIKSEHKQIKERCRRLEVENEGQRLAWEIHGVDELLAEKKTSFTKRKRKSGEIFKNPRACFA